MSNVHSTVIADTFEIGKYVAYKRKIGNGVSGTIYKGYHKMTKKEVAIKEIQVSDITKIQKNINTEVFVMSQLKHPNIVQYNDHILDTKCNNIYVIMEYCEKGDFHKFQRGRSIQEVHVQKFMKQLASGLKYLKQRGIMHRDLKPQNILVTKEGNLKLTDFGFAKIINKNAMIKTYCGTPLYMAPEIIECKGQTEYTDVSDLWSVGCIFYEMLVGTQPYQASSMFELKKKIEKNNEIYFPKHLIISDECKLLVNQLLEYNPAKRISWEDFFEHAWFDKDLLEEEENKLLAFNINDKFDKSIGAFTTDLPSLSLYKKNIKIFASTHLTESEKKRFRLRDNKISNHVLSSSISNKSSQGYIVVGTPPDKIQEKERLQQLTKMIEEKVESNLIEDRKIDDIYKEHQQQNEDHEHDIPEEMFYSCQSENGINDNFTKNIFKPHYQNKTDNPLDILINSKESEQELSFNFNDVFNDNQNEYDDNQNEFDDDDNNAMLTESTNENYFEDHFKAPESSDTYNFSTSLICTGNSMVAENTEPFVVVKTPINPITTSDQHEYKKAKNRSKFKTMVKSSFGLLRESFNYINSYNNSL
jgi:serine/threonine protein kinase